MKLDQKNNVIEVRWCQPSRGVDCTKAVDVALKAGVAVKPIVHDYDEDDDEGDPEGEGICVPLKLSLFQQRGWVSAACDQALVAVPPCTRLPTAFC